MADPLEELYRLQKKDIKRAAETFADAFQNDPVWSAIFLDFKNDRGRIRAIYEIPVRFCMKYGSVYSTGEQLQGIAAWLPGECAGFKVLRMIRSGAILSGMKIGFKIAKRMMPIFRPIETDRKKNMKGKDFIYLQIIGVAGEFQGKGIGGTLLRALIAESERNRKALYLETETERNVAMYERFGFRTIRKITLPIIGLPMWEMVREAPT